MEIYHFLIRFVSCLLTIRTVFGFMTGAPDWSCKDPSAFHTLRLNASHEGIIMPQDMSTSPFMVEVGATEFGPGSKVKVTLRSKKKKKGKEKNRTFIKGFFIQAVQANILVRDLRRQPFGTFKGTTKNERASKCQPINNIPRGGATHANSSPKKKAKVVWIAPSDFNPGPIQFLVTVASDYSTYWTDIRSPVLKPVGYPQAKETVPFYWTPTASWFRWLQYVQQQQLLMDYISQSTNQINGPSSQEAGTESITTTTEQQNPTSASNSKDITKTTESKSDKPVSKTKMDAKQEPTKITQENKHPEMKLSSEKTTSETKMSVATQQLPASDPVTMTTSSKTQSGSTEVNL